MTQYQTLSHQDLMQTQRLPSGWQYLTNSSRQGSPLSLVPSRYKSYCVPPRDFLTYDRVAVGSNFRVTLSVPANTTTGTQSILMATLLQPNLPLSGSSSPINVSKQLPSKLLYKLLNCSVVNQDNSTRAPCFLSLIHVEALICCLQYSRRSTLGTGISLLKWITKSKTLCFGGCRAKMLQMMSVDLISLWFSASSNQVSSGSIGQQMYL